ncbi:hypothetical protein Poli38472_007826 [Pythium oligandrum]|uniref:PHD-type domain-containing protein n=1 Tax=Pythium oligandrum TaxID=41045 RepID=A0A8K1CRA5_PYTOL|nr:hypothetical protein Poli38472_007826 [Pythium oligandrum]|eukprot:TMW68154.1 hypothetical protein Poli38472_007826 [Pythium oligandrum]
MEDPEEYYDVDEEYDDEQQDDHGKKVAYPPRLMVDFTRLSMTALLRYAQVYQLTVRDDYGKDELAALVARHFDCSLEVEEDESIVSFMQRVRNGEKSAVRHRPPEKDRKNDKKRKKSNSRKRQREASVSTASTKESHSSAGSSTASGNGKHDDDRKAPSSSGSHSSSSSGSSHAAKNGGKKTESKKNNDNGEDNELYCICNQPSYGNMIACDGKKCPNPSQWYHLECVGFSDGRHPDTWLCPECDLKSLDKNKKKKTKVRSKSPGSK